MTLIYYDDNDNITVKMIEDYYWFKYFLKSFEFDIIDNPYIKQLVLIDFKHCKKDKTTLYKEIYNIVLEIINKYDLKRFIKINRTLDVYKNGYYVKNNVVYICCIIMSMVFNNYYKNKQFKLPYKEHKPYYYYKKILINMLKTK